MTIKLGSSTEINTVAIIEPYGDDIKKYEEVDTPWVRPSEWLDMPIIGSGDDKIAILMYMASGVALEPSIYIRGQNAAAGYHTYSLINWGDGNTSIASGSSVTASDPNYIDAQNHSYNYEDLPAGSEFIHDGMTCRQALIQIDNTASGCSYLRLDRLCANDIYQDYNNTIANFQSSTALEINIASQNLEEAYLTDIYRCNHSDLERLVVHSPQSLTSTNLSYCFGNMERLQSAVLSSGLFSNNFYFTGFFANCKKLVNVPYLDTSSAGRFDSMFSGCSKIKEIPNFDSSNVTQFQSMFSNCLSLESLPELDYSNATNFYGLVQNAPIKNFPSGLSYPNVTNIAYMFAGCKDLAVVPNDFFDDLTNVTEAAGAFQYCTNLKSMPKINLPSCTNLSNFMASCTSVKKIEIGDVSSVTNFYNTFNGLTSLRTAAFEFPENINGTNGLQMFYNCGFETAPYFNTSTFTTLNSAFNGCSNLKSAPVYDLSSCTDIGSMFFNCGLLKRIGGFKNINNKLTSAFWSFRSCNVLEEIPSGLFVDFNSGGTNCSNIFYPCRGLEVVPSLNLSGVDNAVGFFQDAQNIRHIKEIIFNSGMNCQNMFYNCTSIRLIDESDASLVSNLGNAFYNCNNLEECNISGMSVSTSFYNGLLGSGSIENIFHRLASGVVGQSIDIRQNYGAYQLHADTIAIATSKGWTVTT